MRVPQTRRCGESGSAFKNREMGGGRRGRRWAAQWSGEGGGSGGWKEEGCLDPAATELHGGGT
jgi:hypothetical protein